MDRDLFIETYPRLYHMAHHEALPRILEHGLLSTSALLDLFEVDGARRAEIETKMRPASVVIEHPNYGRAVIRDQKPIGSDQQLAKALNGTTTTADWHRLLNSKVFFWLTEERLNRLRNAAAYREDPQLVLTLDTARFVDAMAEQIWLSSMNSGACRPFPHPRSPATFQLLDNYDFESWKAKKRSRDAVVECAVDGKIDEVDTLLISAAVVE